MNVKIKNQPGGVEEGKGEECVQEVKAYGLGAQWLVVYARKARMAKMEKVVFYILLFFRPLFSSFSNRLGESQFTILHFSVTDLIT